METITKEKKQVLKKPVKITAVKKQSEEEAKKSEKYIEATGRRKTSVARVRLMNAPENRSGIVVNEKSLDNYFFSPEIAKTATAALRKMKILNKFYITAKIKGGGIHSQAEAFRHASARALTKFNLEFRKRLKRSGYLIRDPRAKERRKFGLKKARKAPQWSKR